MVEGVSNQKFVITEKQNTYYRNGRDIQYDPTAERLTEGERKTWFMKGSNPIPTKLPTPTRSLIRNTKQSQQSQPDQTSQTQNRTCMLSPRYQTTHPHPLRPPPPIVTGFSKNCSGQPANYATITSSIWNSHTLIRTFSPRHTLLQIFAPGTSLVGSYVDSRNTT